MQQYLPLAVLKHKTVVLPAHSEVATVLTACGIETTISKPEYYGVAVATVLTACGIETSINSKILRMISSMVATVLTACGIETLFIVKKSTAIEMLQQYLPLAVLKLTEMDTVETLDLRLQQYLPLAVLKLSYSNSTAIEVRSSLQQYLPLAVLKLTENFAGFGAAIGCNSTYRLRY